MKGWLTALAAAGALAVPATAAAEATTFTFTQHVEFSQKTANPCVGKPAGSALFSGFFDQTLHISTDDTGGQHVVNEMDFHLSATSAAGTRYVLATSATRFEENDTTGATEFTFVAPIHFITTGPDTPTDDLNAQVVNHVTVNANGEPTSSTFELRDECQ